MFKAVLDVVQVGDMILDLVIEAEPNIQVNTEIVIAIDNPERCAWRLGAVNALQLGNESIGFHAGLLLVVGLADLCAPFAMRRSAHEEITVSHI